MRRTVLSLVVTLVACATGETGMAQRAGGPAPAGARAAQPAGEISGRVLSADGSPLRAAQVEARSAGRPSGQSLLTDTEGRFLLRDLAPGLWNVTASKAGFITMQAGQRDPRQLAPPVRLPGGGRLTVDFVLSRGAAISGTIFDEYGDPLAGASVSVMTARHSQNRFESLPARTDRTDDTGAFRIHSLSPGTYVVAASRLPTTPGEPGFGTPAGPTYFPGTASPTDAQRLTLRLGEERSSLAFTVMPARAVRVSGTLVDSNGTPVEGGEVTLRDPWNVGPTMTPFGNFGQTHPGGRFGIINVPPGDYVLTASVTRAGSEPETAYVPVTVGSEDLANIVLATQKPASIEGVVVAEPGMQLPASLRARITARSPRSATQSQAATSERESGRFVLSGLFGQVTFGVDALPDGWIVKSFELAGTEVTDASVELPSGARMSSRVVLSNRSGRVNGTLESPQGGTEGAFVVIFPADRVPRNLSSRFVRVLQQNGPGPFTVASLPPRADYLAVAVDYLDDGGIVDADFLESIRPRATPFAVAEGETRVLNLTVVGR